MPSQKTNSFRLCAKGFRGIGLSPPGADALCISDIANLRPSSNGSLEKRCGYAPLFGSSSPIRAIITTQEGESMVIYMLRDIDVLRFCPESGILQAIGQVDSMTGPSVFFYHQAQLYLMDSDLLYRILPDSVTSIEGYIPLIGKDWPNNVIGAPHEPMNLLHSKARLTYVVANPPSIFLRVPYPLQKIYSVIKNGTVLTEEDYYLDTRFNTVNVPGLQPDDQVSVMVGLASPFTESTDALYSSEFATPLSMTDQGQVCLWGDGVTASLFPSRRVGDDAMAESLAFSAESVPLYFPADAKLTVADDRFPVRGVTPYRDKLLIFTEEQTWMATAKEGSPSGLSLCHVNSALGCTAHGGAVLAGNDPVTLTQGSVLRWRNASDGWSEATRLSETIDGRFSSDFYRSAQICHHMEHGELWMNDPARKCIWICRLATGDWFRYTGVDADQLVPMGATVGFIKNGYLFSFQEKLTRDHPASNMTVPIEAELSFSPSSLGTEDRKTVTALTLCTDPDGEEWEASLTEGDLPVPVSRSFPPREGYGLLRARCPTGRFLSAALSIRAHGNGRPRLHGFTLQFK